MAGFTRVNGDFLPVAVYDNGTGNAYINSGNVNAVTSAATVQPQGPALQFFTVAGQANCLIIANTLPVIQTIEQLATVMIYEATSTGNGNLAIATYPAGAWDSASLALAITNALLPSTGNVANTYSVTVTASATFTN